MQQATESMWFTNEDGVDVFIARGKVLPDNHPHVKRMAAHFEPVDSGEPAAAAPKTPSKPAKPEK
jgi:hypothetical protein